MSCIHCTNKNYGSENQYPCLCDKFIHPAPLKISAGLSGLPRQTAMFHEFRRAMLKDLRYEEVELIDSNNVLTKFKPLEYWRAREKDDFGIMLLEMWAYLCDSLSFYDEVLANEMYLRTSDLKPNIRRLVDLLGYIPRPAVGSSVELAAFADGRLLLKLPAGTAFRSGAFDGNPPQVFEITDDVYIHPFTNQTGIVTPHKGVTVKDYPDYLLTELKTEINEDDLLLLINKKHDNYNKGVTVSKIEKYTGVDNQKYCRLNFTTPTDLIKGLPLNELQLLKPSITSGLWTVSELSKSIDGTKITLNKLTSQISPGEFILLEYKGKYRWFKVTKVSEVMRSTVASNDITINGNTFSMPGLSSPVTELTLDESVNSLNRRKPKHTVLTSDHISQVKIHFGMQPAAKVIDEPNSSLISTDPLYFDQTIETPVENYHPEKFLLHDKNTLGVSVNGNLSYDKQKLTVDIPNNWDIALTPPVKIFGNVITATRGEKVSNEIMGSGNASEAGQSFKLKKKPLSYYPSPTADNDSAVKNSLTIYVNGILWKEVSSFYGMGEYDQVYIVRHNDDGESVITFGDGIRGQRLPTGSNNVVCNYRFGAEAACPPGGSVTQISKPVKGLKSVKNVLPAYGGADAEAEENIREYAPKSTLILGRAVSMKDMEAVACSYPGVRAVQAEWRWDKNKQRASAHIFYIGDISLKEGISKNIRNVSDPSTPITVERALPNPLVLNLEIKINDRYLEEDVINEIRQSLINVESGLLAPEKIGIGKPLFRSRIFEAVLNTEGTDAVSSVKIGENNFDEFAAVPGTGSYFDIEQGELIINGKNK